MKRKALLIGNSNGLQGVKLDIRHFTEFLKHDVGGQWYDDSEIEIKMNPSKRDLLATIQLLKNAKYDFVLTMYSGHGAFEKNRYDTLLEINAQEEYIYESDLKNIATRQISIFDCCRKSIKIYDSLNERMMKSFSNSLNGTINIRAKYETRIMQAIEQQVSLYACSVDETALDTENGGLYIQNLLKAATNVSNEYKLVGTAHEEAMEATKNEAWNKEKHTQNPTATLPKCISSQQLIIGINPNYNPYRYL
jgi:hypothetical protein